MALIPMLVIIVLIGLLIFLEEKFLTLGEPARSAIRIVAGVIIFVLLLAWILHVFGYGPAVNPHAPLG